MAPSPPTPPPPAFPGVPSPHLPGGVWEGFVGGREFENSRARPSNLTLQRSEAGAGTQALPCPLLKKAGGEKPGGQRLWATPASPDEASPPGSPEAERWEQVSRQPPSRLRSKQGQEVGCLARSCYACYSGLSAAVLAPTLALDADRTSWETKGSCLSTSTLSLGPLPCSHSRAR